MSWKQLLWIYMIICVVLIACVARHFLGDMIFLAEHLIASSSVYLPGFLHFVAGHLR
jgi:hypothetical protein